MSVGLYTWVCVRLCVDAFVLSLRVSGLCVWVCVCVCALGCLGVYLCLGICVFARC